MAVEPASRIVAGPPCFLESDSETVNIHVMSDYDERITTIASDLGQRSQPEFAFMPAKE